jgi:hypothetical protein
LTEVGRVVALGASNLARGFRTVVTAASAAWGPGVEVLAALGHGRSYGGRSRFLARTLPSILECGLWRDIEALPPTRTRALLTDVGNDILYGASADQTLAWVEEAAGRLRRFTDDIVITDLPMASIRQLSEARFLLFRSILVPSCRLSLGQVLESAERVNAGLDKLAAASGARLFHLKPTWYGIDPVHIRASLWRRAWREIFGIPSEAGTGRYSVLEGARLYLMRPERRWIFGKEQVTPQAGVSLRSGGRVWLY